MDIESSALRGMLMTLFFSDIDLPKGISQKKRRFVQHGLKCLYWAFADNLDSISQDDHPLGWWLMLKPGEFWWKCHLARIGIMIDSFSNNEGFEGIKKRLYIPREFFGALTEIETAAMLIESGAKVQFLKPTEKRTGDLLVSFDEKNIYVEVTTLAQSPDVALQFERMTKLRYSTIIVPEIDSAIKVRKRLSEKRTEEIIQNIRDGTIKVQNGVKPFIEYIDDYVEYMIAKKSVGNLVNSWRYARGLPQDIAIVYPGIHDNVSRRIRARLQSKSLHQMDPEKPWLFHLGLIPHITQQRQKPETIIEYIGELLEDQGHVLLCLISGWFEEKTTDKVACRKVLHSVIRERTICSRRDEELLMIPNRYSKFKDLRPLVVNLVNTMCSAKDAYSSIRTVS